MSTDNELLELAAKAAGYRFDSTDPFEIADEHKGGTNWIEWNPLADDGDALRLAVFLKMEIETYSFGMDTGPCVNVLTWGDRMKGFSRSFHQRVSDEDYLSATRKAVVMAAAKIGRGMK